MAIKQVVFSKDSKRLASRDVGGTIIIWDTTTGDQIEELDTDGVRDAIFSDNLDMIAFDHIDGSIDVLSIITNRKTQKLEDSEEDLDRFDYNWTGTSFPHDTFREQNKLKPLDFTTDGTSLLTRSGRGELELWNVETGQMISTLHSCCHTAVSARMPDNRNGILSVDYYGTLMT